MTAKPKPPGVEKHLTTGNIWTILVTISAFVGSTGYQHYVPSDAAAHAQKASDDAASKAAAAAAKAAVIEQTVATHTSEIALVAASVDQLKLDVAVLKSQGESAKAAALSNSEKLDRLLSAVYKMEGAAHAEGPSAR